MSDRRAMPLRSAINYAELVSSESSDNWTDSEEAAVVLWREVEHLHDTIRSMSPERWRYASFINPPHQHEWTDHAHCIMCGIRYDSLPDLTQGNQHK